MISLIIQQLYREILAVADENGGKLKLFLKWGIEFDEDNPYAVSDHGGREVQYAEKKEIMDGIVQKYHPEWLIKEEPPEDSESTGGLNQAESQSHEAQQTPPNKPKDKESGGGQGASLRTVRCQHSEPPQEPQEVKSDGQT